MIVTHEPTVFTGVAVRVGVGAHRAGLGVVVGRLCVEIHEILGTVLANTQVTHGHLGRARACTSARLSHVLAQVDLLVLIRLRVVAAVFAPCVRVRVRVRIRIVGALLLLRRHIARPLRARVGFLPLSRAPAVLSFHLLLTPLGLLGCQLGDLLLLLCLEPHLDLLLIIRDDSRVVGRVVLCPVVALASVIERHLHNQFVRGDPLPRELGALLPRPFDAVHCLVRHCATVCTSTFAEGGRGGARLLTAGLEVGRDGHLLLPLPVLGVLQARSVLVEVPRRLRHVLRDVRVDLLAVLIKLGGDRPRLTRLLQLALTAVVIA
mmetsp:Transcript_58515/g.130367  ORF Transcript_58515/g.130367 Transcript_58515/m.130367 type:complete len:320 (-) Transcript_58515:58-1017(-)